MKKIFVFAIMALVAVNTVSPKAVKIDTAISNAAKEILESVPQGTRIAGGGASQCTIKVFH